MCGIAGIVDFERRLDSREITEKMLRTISYRGPDECGIYHSPVAALGSVRLSIIDLQSGQQPLSDPTSRYWIVFNGEIFNYKELRRDLEKTGVSFITNSDTEVLLQLYVRYGHKCLDLLNGQFAFSVWDRYEEELFIARDRMGIRPFFYNIRNGIFTFASEIKAIFRQSSIPRELNPAGLNQIYTFWTALTPDTAFKGIFELPPGHFGYFNKTGLRTQKYWELDFSRARNSSMTLEEALAGFDELFTDAVRIRLRADVEVGAYLSGGIDSSATVAYIKNIEPGILNTFSIGFKDKDFDESQYQNKAVSYFNTTHQQYTCTSEEIGDVFPDIIWHSELPLTRTAPAPMFLLSRLVRENNIKVVVTGEGADEFLAGYDIFKETVIRRFWASQPDSKFRPLLLKRLYQYIPQIADANLQTIKMFFRYNLEDVSNPFYSHLLRWNNSNHIKKHYSEEIKEATALTSPFDQLALRLPRDFDRLDPLSKAQWLEAVIFMSGYLLSSQGDRMSMANSVEGRYPFLDFRVIEFCNSLPSKFKLNGLTEKYLLRKLLKNKIPDSILSRVKQPYRAPAGNVFLDKNSPAYVQEMLSEEQTSRAGIFNFKSISQVLSKIRRNGNTSEMDDMLITSIISTHLLYNQFIENKNEIFSRVRNTEIRIVEDTRPVFV
ncbi:MAG TPA: asparagine synthase (glutamine-hydrolyzing) [Bacteroidales bacterium]|nr:asparagine synthase (glutamine-hydrolyzing) [Bacteroidales bacterium]